MNSDVNFGVLLPTLGNHASQDAINRLATTAEDCGFDALWAGDHLTFPADIPKEHPFSPTGESPFHVSHNAYDLFGVLNYLAGITNDVEIGSNTCIVPYGHPVVLARNALTVEALRTGGSTSESALDGCGPSSRCSMSHTTSAAVEPTSSSERVIQ